jgi:hypothetical protein
VQKGLFGLWLNNFERARGFSIKIRAKLKGFYMVEGPGCKIYKRQGLF